MEISRSVSLWAVMAAMFLHKSGIFMLDATVRAYTNLCVCRQMFLPNMSLCSSGIFIRQHEIQIQTTAASYLMYYRILLYVPSIIIGPYLGAWSDRSGRVPPMLISVTGCVFAVPVYLMSWHFPEYSLVLYLAGSAIQGIFCTTFLFNMAVNTYMAENVPKEETTKKLSLLMAMHVLGQFTGALLAGVFQDTTNLQITLCVTSVFQTCAALSIVICIPERFIPNETKSASFISGLKESLLVIFKTRGGHSRCIIVLIFFLIILDSTCSTGEADITVLYVQGNPLHWPVSWYGYYNAVEKCLQIIFFFAVEPFLFLKISDLSIMLMGTIIRIFRTVWSSLSVISWMMWLSGVLNFMGSINVSIIRSLISKQVESGELGKMYALMGSIDMAVRPVASVLFAGVYAGTLYIFPGMAYVVLSFVLSTYFMIVLCIYRIDVRPTS